MGWRDGCVYFFVFRVYGGRCLLFLYFFIKFGGDLGVFRIVVIIWLNVLFKENLLINLG